MKRLVALLTALLLAVGLAAAPSSARGAFFDPDLRARLDRTDGLLRVQAVVNFDPRLTTGPALSAAIQDLGAGTLTFQHLDSVAVLATRLELDLIALLPGVTAIYDNRPLRYYLHDSVPQIGADRVWSELGVTGRGIGVAVLDTGIDGNHSDVEYGSKLVQNVKIVADPSAVYSFKGRLGQPLYLEGQKNTDTSSGHGTHVAGTAAGSGVASGGYYTGVAKGAHLLGIGAGDALFIVWALAGFDYLLEHAATYNVKVVNNSWGTERKAAAYDPTDPINLASKKAHDRGITVVFAAGNAGPAPDTLNHYAMPPWVIGVAAGCKTVDRAHCPDGLLTDFSSRGAPGTRFHPTVTAPGAHIVAPRALTGVVMNVLDTPHDLTVCSDYDVPDYTCASGTSMASPHVAGTVALMQEAARGRLTSDQVKSVIVRTAQPMRRRDGTPYAVWEVGAGYLDAYAAVRASQR